MHQQRRCQKSCFISHSVQYLLFIPSKKPGLSLPMIIFRRVLSVSHANIGSGLALFGVGGALRPSPVLFPQTAFSDCVPWTDTRHRSSSGRQQNLEATAPPMRFSSTSFTYVQETLLTHQLDDWGLTGCLFPCSTLLTWRRSKTSLKTANCWEQSSSMETSSRWVKQAV